MSTTDTNDAAWHVSHPIPRAVGLILFGRGVCPTHPRAAVMVKGKFIRILLLAWGTQTVVLVASHGGHNASRLARMGLPQLPAAQ